MTSLTPATIGQLESRLRVHRQDILGTIREHLHSDDPGTMGLANHYHEVDDDAAADQLNNIDLAHVSHELAELRNIDAALARIKTGKYGTCATCGEPISSERMGAYLTAKLCLVCQEEAEERQGRMHNPSL